MTDLTDAIQRGWATADPDAPEPAVAYFHNLLAEHPEDRVFLALALTSAGRCHEAVQILIALALDHIDGDELQVAPPLRMAGG